ncbi:hypothetical protein Ccrd_006295 [Cynara cardunculus var. scolymus]|uniref:Uncharacterized protein n=1 Tax=Cynara cardunculus var. scolymus TaxID=59895 RepID=A0A103XJ36_CYNCS|nr:hypothetical protein Ccrd_006295 [Cynara cardunculus var. scolymus]
MVLMVLGDDIGMASNAEIFCSPQIPTCSFEAYLSVVQTWSLFQASCRFLHFSSIVLDVFVNLYFE